MVVCHCNNCKKWSGSAFATNIHFPRSALTLNDSSKITVYSDGATKSSRTIQRHFCSACGCPLYIIGPHKPDIVNIASGVLDGLTDALGDGTAMAEEDKRLAGLRPSLEVYTEAKCPWIDVTLHE